LSGFPNQLNVWFLFRATVDATAGDWSSDARMTLETVRIIEKSYANIERQHPISTLMPAA